MSLAKAIPCIEQRTCFFFAIVAHTILFCCRQNPLPNDDRLYQSLDAGYVFSERKDWPISQHPPTKSIRESVPQWRRSLQYTCVTDMRLFHAPGALPSWHADLQSRCGQLWVYFYLIYLLCNKITYVYRVVVRSLIGWVQKKNSQYPSVIKMLAHFF